MTQTPFKICKLRGMQSRHAGIAKWAWPPGYTKTQIAFHKIGWEIEDENPGTYEKLTIPVQKGKCKA